MSAVGELRAVSVLGSQMPPVRWEFSGMRGDGVFDTAAVPGVAGSERQPAVVALGAFDGVHQGHRALIAAARADADQRGVALVVVLFDPDPAEVLREVGPEPLSRLLSVDDRAALLLRLYADAIMRIPFTTELAALSPEDFVHELLWRSVQMVSVHVGENFHFGARGAGSVKTLQELGSELGFNVVAHPLVEAEGSRVSSTRIRGLVRAGKVEEAARLLVRPHLVRGHVEHGRGEGTQMGFPTANVVVDSVVCMPGEGVYAAWAVMGDSAWPAAVNVGSPVSFDNRARPSFAEANLLGFSGDIYEQEMALVFVAWLRASRHFSSLEELERVVMGNICWVREHLGEGARALGERGVWELGGFE